MPKSCRQLETELGDEPGTQPRACLLGHWAVLPLEELYSGKDWGQGDRIKKVLEAKDGEGRGSVAGKGDEQRLPMHQRYLPSHSDQNGPTSVACQWAPSLALFPAVSPSCCPRHASPDGFWSEGEERTALAGSHDVIPTRLRAVVIGAPGEVRLPITDP